MRRQRVTRLRADGSGMTRYAPMTPACAGPWPEAVVELTAVPWVPALWRTAMARVNTRRCPRPGFESYHSTNAFSMTKWPGSLWLPSRKPRALEHHLQFFQHAGAAAHHDAVGLDVERRLVDVVEQLLRGDQVGDAATVAKRLARHGRIIQQLLRQQRPEQLVVAELRDQFLAIGEFEDLAAAVHQNDARSDRRRRGP